MTDSMRKLELRVYELLLHYPERLDQMETRNEDACRRLARKVVDLVAEEMPAEATGKTKG